MLTKMITSFDEVMAHLHTDKLSNIIFNAKLAAEIAPNVKPKYPRLLLPNRQSNFA